MPRPVHDNSMNGRLRVKELMSTPAARIMRERDVGCLPILREGALVGIVTRGDLIAHAEV